MEENTQYDYNALKAEELREIGRSISIKNQRALKAEVIHQILGWEKKNFPKIAAYQERPLKKNTGRRANWSPSKQANSQPVPAPIPGAPRQAVKRKQPALFPGPIARAKRQKIAGRDVATGTGETETAGVKEDSRIDNDEDEYMFDDPVEETPARPKKLPMSRQHALPTIVQGFDEITAPKPPRLCLTSDAREPPLPTVPDSTNTTIDSYNTASPNDVSGGTGANKTATPEVLATRAQPEKMKKQMMEEEEARLHLLRPLSAYVDQKVSELFRVKHRTIKLPFDNDIPRGKKRAPMIRICGQRQMERMKEEAERDGIEIPVWKGGPWFPEQEPWPDMEDYVPYD
jgi:hypothetical protein